MWGRTSGKRAREAWQILSRQSNDRTREHLQKITISKSGKWPKTYNKLRTSTSRKTLNLSRNSESPQSWSLGLLSCLNPKLHDWYLPPQLSSLGMEAEPHAQGICQKQSLNGKPLGKSDTAAFWGYTIWSKWWIQTFTSHHT